MQEYDYWTEETAIMEYTNDLRYELNDAKAFNAIFNCFKKKDLYSLAQLMTTMAKGRNNLHTTIRELKSKVSYLTAEVEKKESVIIRVTAELDELKKHIPSKDILLNERVKTLYSQHKSLRKVSEYLGCDKSTVKRHLIKMGYTLDNNSR